MSLSEDGRWTEQVCRECDVSRERGHQVTHGLTPVASARSEVSHGHSYVAGPSVGSGGVQSHHVPGGTSVTRFKALLSTAKEQEI